MHMVGHQAVGQNLQSKLGGILNQELKIMLPIIVAEKNISPAIAALRDVVAQARDHDSGDPRHEATSLGNAPA
jgi:hypothetical protein